MTVSVLYDFGGGRLSGGAGKPEWEVQALVVGGFGYEFQVRKDAVQGPRRRPRRVGKRRRSKGGDYHESIRS